MPALPSLSYARTYTQFGVTVDAGEHTLAITLSHPRPRWLALTLGVVFLVAVLPRSIATVRTGRDVIFALGSALLWSAILWVVWHRSGNTTRLRFGPSEATFDGLPPQAGNSNHPRHRRIRLDAIYRVYYEPNARAIFFRVRGEEMIEIPLGYGHIAAEELCSDICRWLSLNVALAAADPPPIDATPKCR